MKNLLRENLRKFFEAADDAAALKLLEAGEFSFDEIYTALYAALRLNRVAPDGSYIYRWIRDLYEGYVIYEEEIGYDGAPKLYKAGYSIAADGTATLSAPVQVRVEYVVVATTTPTVESSHLNLGQIIKLTERALDDKNIAYIKLIGTGWGSSGYYSESLLRSYGSTAFPAGTHMFWNHPTVSESIDRPERDLDYLASVLIESAGYLPNGAAGPGLYAKVRVFENYADRLEDIAEAIGTSINATGTGKWGEAEGREGLIIESLLPSPFNTIDYVTVPGAGGAIVQLFESAATRAKEAHHSDKVMCQLREAVPSYEAPQGAPPEAIPVGKALSASPAIRLNESNINKVPGGHVETKDTKLTEAESRATAAEAETARLKEALAVTEAKGEAKTVATEVLAGIEMPASTRTRLAETLGGSPILKDGKLDKDAFKTVVEAAAKSELEYLQEATGYGKGGVQDLGSAGDETVTVIESAPPGIGEARAVLGL